MTLTTAAKIVQRVSRYGPCPRDTVLDRMCNLWEDKWRRVTDDMLYPEDWVDNDRARAAANVIEVFRAVADGYHSIHLYKKRHDGCPLIPGSRACDLNEDCPRYPSDEPW